MAVFSSIARPELVHIKTPLTVDIQLGNTIAVLGKTAAKGQHCRVLDTGGYHMATVRKNLQRRADGSIVTLGSTGR